MSIKITSEIGPTQEEEEEEEGEDEEEEEEEEEMMIMMMMMVMMMMIMMIERDENMISFTMIIQCTSMFDKPRAFVVFYFCNTHLSTLKLLLHQLPVSRSNAAAVPV